MAIYHLQFRSISRGDGRSATGAAAYRAGEAIRDLRTGRLHNHSRRTDVMHKEILLPSTGNGAQASWALDRAALWNRAEQAENRRNSRVAREYEVALPAELDPAQRLGLTRAFAQDLADRHGVAVDLAIHAPRPQGDARNYHAHLLATTREVTAQGLAAKAGLDMSSAERSRRGLPPSIAEFNVVRERWADLTNEALRAAGLAAWVDHRSLAAQGIDREPMPRIPYAAIQAERHGLRSGLAERIRANYRERVAARIEASERSATRTAAPEPAVAAAGSLAELRRAAREAWLRMRAQVVPEPGLVRDGARAAEREPEHQNDQGLER
jgi:ATP-dependent exoDNAse (exonuclease V) alpha subunit